MNCGVVSLGWGLGEGVGMKLWAFPGGFLLANFGRLLL